METGSSRKTEFMMYFFQLPNEAFSAGKAMNIPTGDADGCGQFDCVR